MHIRSLEGPEVTSQLLDFPVGIVSLCYCVMKAVQFQQTLPGVTSSAWFYGSHLSLRHCFDSFARQIWLARSH